MTLESTICKNRYIGNGATKVFPFTFRAWKTNQVQVMIGDGTYDKHVASICSIELSASGGTVTFPEPPAYGVVIVIRRSMPFVQQDDYRNGTRFDSEEIEDRLDQDCAERQELRERVDRCIKTPSTSSKSSEEYQQEFWDAYSDTLAKRDAVSVMHAEVMAERPIAVAAIDSAKAAAVDAVANEGDHQAQRLENIAPIIMADTGNACMETNWTLPADIAVGSDIDIAPLWYVVGRHHLQVSVNGVRQYRGKQYDEAGADSAHSHMFKTLVALHEGDTVNVWICHLSGKDVSATATHEMDGLMASGDKVKLDAMPAFTGIARTTHVLASAVSAGTAITVPEHAVGSGLLMVWHNGVLCESGPAAQYVDFSSTSVKFNYNIPAGDTITAAAVAVTA